jgi:SAM-dependent methyltransferase
MDTQYAAAYRTLYERHWWWRAREALLTREIARLAGSRPLGRILDVGCGDGLFLPALQRFGEPYGVEPAVSVLSPDGPWRDRIHAGSLASYRPPAPFDLVLALDVIEHLRDPGAFLEQIRGVTAPGGWLVATVPAFRGLWTTHDDLNEHVTRFTREELAALIRAHGFVVVHARYFMVALAVAKWFVRRLEGVRRPQPRVPRVPAAAFNAGLQFVCRAEQALIGRRAPWFGSSLLLVARAPGNPGEPVSEARPDANAPRGSG